VRRASVPEERVGGDGVSPEYQVGVSLQHCSAWAVRTCNVGMACMSVFAAAAAAAAAAALLLLVLQVEEGERQRRMDANIDDIYREMNSQLYNPGQVGLFLSCLGGTGPHGRVLCLAEEGAVCDQYAVLTGGLCRLVY
jgi:hypothetical protein